MMSASCCATRLRVGYMLLWLDGVTRQLATDKIPSQSKLVSKTQSLVYDRYMGVSRHGDTPIAGWFKVGNPMCKWMI